MKTRIVMAAGLISILTACGGGGGKQVLIDACMDEGETRENCTCVATAAEESLDEDLFAKVVEAVSSGDSDLALLNSDLGVEEIQQLAGFALSVGTKCDANFN
ncbi:MAG: hypothetical protein AAF292_05410 [Pseudomonadota bacterium]